VIARRVEYNQDGPERVRGRVRRGASGLDHERLRLILQGTSSPTWSRFGGNIMKLADEALSIARQRAGDVAALPVTITTNLRRKTF
jgi:hypothetical protein